MQLAALLSYGEKLYTACYNFESDGQFIFRAFEEWRKVIASLPADGPYPRPLKDVMKTIASDSESDYTFEDLRALVAEILQPARVYMAQQEMTHSYTIKVFKAASLWNPLGAKYINITPEILYAYISPLPIITADDRRALEEEYVEYKAACDLVDVGVKVISTHFSFKWRLLIHF